MRIVLADIKGGAGFTSKDTVAGGYGSRLRPFSNVTRIIARLKGGFHDMPSVQLAYAAALAKHAGHSVTSSSGELVDGDVDAPLQHVDADDVTFDRADARRDQAEGTRTDGEPHTHEDVRDRPG